MTTLTMRRSHSLGTEQARRKLLELERSLAPKFGLTCTWRKPERVDLRRKGVEATISFDETTVEIRAQLEFPVSLIKKQIEAAVGSYLDQVLS